MIDDSYGINTPIDDLIAQVRRRAATLEEPPRGRFAAIRERMQPLEVATRSGRRRRRRTNLITLAVSVALVGATVAVIATPSDGVGSRRGAAPAARQAAAHGVRPVVAVSTTLTAASTAESADAATALDLALLPGDWRKSCRVAPGLDSRVRRSFVCPIGEHRRVEVRIVAQRGRADSLERASLKLASLLRRLAQDFAGGARARGSSVCGGTRLQRWSLPKSPQRSRGQFACGTTARGAEVLWSVEAKGIVLRCIGNDGDVDALLAWWEQAKI